MDEMSHQEDMDVDQCSSDIEDGVSKNPEKNFVDTEYRLKFHSDDSSSSESEAEEPQEEPEAKHEPILEPKAEVNGGAQESVANGNKLEEFRRPRRSRSRSAEKKEKHTSQRNSRRSEEVPFDDEQDRSGRVPDVQMKNAKEDEFWRKRRVDRERIGDRGARSTWGHSPSHGDLEEVFELHESVNKKAELYLKKTQKPEDKKKHSKKRKRDSSTNSTASSDSSSSERRHKKKKRKHKKEHKKKHHKKEKKRRRNSTSKSQEKDVKEDEEEWVELTKELRDKEAQKMKEEEATVIGPQIPEHLLAEAHSPTYEGKLDAQDRKNMLRGEAAAMAAYAAQGKRIPRRGEIGLSSDEISVFEKVGYVMSGTRHKSMEATRLRKENQILTAEEKRLLNTFTSEERQKREDTVLKQFHELISSKKKN